MISYVKASYVFKICIFHLSMVYKINYYLSFDMARAVNGHSCPHWSLGFYLVALSEAIVLNVLSFILIQYMFPKPVFLVMELLKIYESKDFLCES